MDKGTNQENKSGVGKCASQGSHEAEQTQGNEEHGIEWDQGHPALAILTASIHKIWLEERFKCLPGVLKTPGQVLSPSGKEEHPVQDQGKLGQHRQCGVSGKITKIALLDHLQKLSSESGALSANLL